MLALRRSEFAPTHFSLPFLYFASSVQAFLTVPVKSVCLVPGYKISKIVFVTDMANDTGRFSIESNDAFYELAKTAVLSDENILYLLVCLVDKLRRTQLHQHLIKCCSQDTDPLAIA